MIFFVLMKFGVNIKRNYPLQLPLCKGELEGVVSEEQKKSVSRRSFLYEDFKSYFFTASFT